MSVLHDEECRIDDEAPELNLEAIPAVVRELVESCTIPPAKAPLAPPTPLASLTPPPASDCFDHIGPVDIPSHEAVIDIIVQVRRILFPGYFTPERIEPVNLEYYIGQEVTGLASKLAEQIVRAISHDCRRLGQSCTECPQRGNDAAIHLINQLPHIRRTLAEDVRAAYDGDPAAASYDDIVFSYPGLYAVTVYRVAHELHKLGVPLLPRIMTEFAHHRTGIDIHPGAVIGQSFFIDHGTGVVIGETCHIGDRVRVYQGVTLGALSLPKGAGETHRGKKRHPTIEDDVIIYAGATILGGGAVIGQRSIIGGNVWLTQSVPADTKVLIKDPELIYIGSDQLKK